MIERTDLKKIFPHSFIDYDGIRCARVVVYGRNKVSEIAERVHKSLDFGESVAVSKLQYNPKTGLTGFVLQASGNTPAFLPRIDVADLQILAEEQKRKAEEEKEAKTSNQDSFTDKFNSFLNL